MLIVAGLDPSGGAGLLADVEAIRAAGGTPLAVCAALTAQGDQGVRAVRPVSGEFVGEQIEALGPVDAFKIGMLGTLSVAGALLRRLDRLPTPVVDPVVRSTSGHALLDGEGAALLRDEIVPRALAVTPNLAEAAWLTGRVVETVPQMAAAAAALLDAGCRIAVVTGGHLEGPVVDVVATAGTEPVQIRRERLPGSLRGTGCRFASYLATRLAQGDDPVTAAEAAGRHVARAIARG